MPASAEITNVLLIPSQYQLAKFCKQGHYQKRGYRQLRHDTHIAEPPSVGKPLKTATPVVPYAIRRRRSAGSLRSCEAVRGLSTRNRPTGEIGPPVDL